MYKYRWTSYTYIVIMIDLPVNIKKLCNTGSNYILSILEMFLCHKSSMNVVCVFYFMSKFT